MTHLRRQRVMDWITEVPSCLALPLTLPTNPLNTYTLCTNTITWFTSRNTRLLLEVWLQLRCQDEPPKPLFFFPASSPKEIQYQVSLARFCPLLRLGWLLKVFTCQLFLSRWLLLTSVPVRLSLGHKVILPTKFDANGVLFIPDSFASQTFRYKVNLWRKVNDDLHMKDCLPCASISHVSDMLVFLSLWLKW